MKLQILVPQYKETDSVIKPLLDSILIQRNVDFKDIGVIITNDGTDVKLSKEFLDSYPFEIKYIQAEHKGVSGARNVCLDNATADYIMFCDADDCFFSSISVENILATIDRLHFDAFQSTFLEEAIDPRNGAHVYIKREHAHVFVHGKIYRLQYIKDLGLRWEERLSYHEDGYFNAIALMSCRADKYVYCTEPFYLWCWNASSVCRSDPYFIVKTYDQDILAQDLILDRIKDYNRPAAMDLFLTQLYQTFFLVTGSHSKVVTLKNYFDMIDDMTADLYLKYIDLWKDISDEQKKQKDTVCRNLAKNQQYLIEKPDYTIDKWLKDIVEKKKRA